MGQEWASLIQMTVKTTTVSKNPMKIMKRQKDMIPEDEHPGQKVSNTLLEKSRGQLLIDPGE